MSKKIGFITLLLVALGVGLNFVGGSKKMEVLKVGYPEYWGKKYVSFSSAYDLC